MPTYETTNQIVVDSSTGEVLHMETSKRFTTKVKTDKFYMTFIEYAAPLFKLTTQSAKDILVWMCCNAEFNTGKIVLAPAERARMMKDLNVTTNTISNSLKKLTSLKIISGDKGVYTLNPQIFWKGDSETRDKMLEVEEIQVNFDIKFKEP